MTYVWLICDMTFWRVNLIILRYCTICGSKLLSGSCSITDVPVSLLYLLRQLRTSLKIETVSKTMMSKASRYRWCSISCVPEQAEGVLDGGFLQSAGFSDGHAPGGDAGAQGLGPRLGRPPQCRDAPQPRGGHRAAGRGRLHPRPLPWRCPFHIYRRRIRVAESSVSSTSTLECRFPHLRLQMLFDDDVVFVVDHKLSSRYRVGQLLPSSVGIGVTRWKLVYFGCWCPGASLDRRTGKLVEAKPKTLYDLMPVVYIYAVQSSAGKDPRMYECPIYRKSMRNTSSYIGSIDLETDINPRHWTLRGVALLCDIKWTSRRRRSSVSLFRFVAFRFYFGLQLFSSQFQRFDSVCFPWCGLQKVGSYRVSMNSVISKTFSFIGHFSFQ